jgi:hypothetical protein
MLYVLKGADFSDNNVGKIELPALDLLADTNTVLGYYTKTLTVKQKNYVDAFVNVLKTNNIWQNVKYLAFPCLAQNLSESLINAVNRPYAVPTIPANVILSENGIRSTVTTIGGGDSVVNLGNFSTFPTPVMGVGFNNNITAGSFTNGWMIRSVTSLGGIQQLNSNKFSRTYAINSVTKLETTSIVTSVVSRQNATDLSMYTKNGTQTIPVAYSTQSEYWRLFNSNVDATSQGFTGAIKVIVAATALTDAQCLTLNNCIDNLISQF